jgi:uncharacterized protein involved in exopolysaccharide biosynthesis
MGDHALLIPMNTERIFTLVKRRFLFVLASGTLVVLGACLIGLSSPYLYRSQAVIQLKPNAKIGEVDFDDVLAVQKAVNLVRSPEVLTAVATDVAQKLPTRIAWAVPQSISTLDLKERRRNLVANLPQLGRFAPEREVAQSTDIDSDILATLLDQNLKVEPEINIRAVRIFYEGGHPEVTKMIATKISEEFIRHLTDRERKDLNAKAELLEKAIQEQLGSVRQSEEEMKKMMFRHPFLAASDSRGTLTMGQKFVEKQESIRRLDSEYETNRRTLGQIRNDLSGRSEATSKINEQIKSKLIRDISELEFKIVQYTKISDYPEDHPEVQSLRNKLASLKYTLKRHQQEELNAKDDSGSPVQDLISKKTSLRERNQKITSEKEVLNRELAQQSSNFKEVASVSFAYESLVREFNMKVALINELYVDLQRTRLAAATVSTKADILSPATLPVHSSSVSLPKRLVFALPVGFALAISLLLLLELMNPTLLSTSDFAQMGVNYFGRCKLRGADFSRMAAYMLSLEQEQQRETKRSGHGIVVALHPASITFDFNRYVSRLIKELHRHGKNVGLIIISDPMESVHPHLASSVAELVEMSTDRVGLDLDREVANLAGSCDIVFLISHTDSLSPSQLFISRSADYFVYVTELGKTQLKTLDSIKSPCKDLEKPKHYALMVDR